MAKGDRVNVIPGELPADYHCSCHYCTKFIGELRPADGSFYSKLERRAYYCKEESGKGGHIAKTPLHIARWAVQAYTESGDWVVDPTIGAGTSAVEALTQGRNVAGMELEYGEILQRNVAMHADHNKAMVQFGDARGIKSLLDQLPARPKLIINNPPYSGDESADSASTRDFKYTDGLPNLAFLKEGEKYWEALNSIYGACIDALEIGGHFVIGVKDMMRKKQPYLLHKMLGDTLTGFGLEFMGTALLKHYPPTLFMSTYEKRYGVPVPVYQTITVHRKVEA